MKLWAIIPELILAGSCLFLVPVAGWARGRWRLLPGIAGAIALLACIATTLPMLDWAPVSAFHGVYAVDGFAHVFKLLIFTGALVTLVLVAGYFRDRREAPHAAVAILFTTLGSTLLVSTLDLGVIVLALQMLSMGIYVLAAIVRTDDRGMEAALKYFIYGAVALAIMAYGLTFLYGMTGSLDLRAIGAALQDGDPLWTGIAFGLVLIGYGFEVTMVPFHPWAPDVLEGATAPVAGFISVVPKIAAFGGLLRFLLEGLAGELVHWPIVVASLAAVTMTVGNLAALDQSRLKRLLAYSTIAQSGYVLMAVAVAARDVGGLSAAAYYLAAYLFMNLGAFAVAAHVERIRGRDTLETLRGLPRQSPGAAAILTLSLLSLAGIPPLAGFAGKVLVLRSTIAGGMTWLALVGIVNMTIALFYYVRVISAMYTHPPAHAAGQLRGRAGFTVTYGLCLVGTFALGIVPGPFLNLLTQASDLL